jgi:hypothetical protein
MFNPLKLVPADTGVDRARWNSCCLRNIRSVKAKCNFSVAGCHENP